MKHVTLERVLSSLTSIGMLCGWLYTQFVSKAAVVSENAAWEASCTNTIVHLAQQCGSCSP